MVMPKYIFEAPTGVNYIRMIQRNILSNLRRGNEPKLYLPFLVERAYQIVFETKSLARATYVGDAVPTENQ